MAVEIADNDKGLETGTLTSGGLLLDRHNLHDLVLQLGEEIVDDLEFLDGQREEVDLFNRADLSVLYETTELGNGNLMS